MVYVIIHCFQHILNEREVDMVYAMVLQYNMLFVHNAMVRMLCDYSLLVEWFKPKVRSLIDIFDGNDCGP